MEDSTMTTDEKLDAILVYTKKMNELKAAIARMSPIIDGSSGVILGAYEEAARDVCKAMEWEFKGNK
jgi:hypothetical protein